MHCFKEWQVVCEAIQQGQQSLILRKGGIHEGKDGFSFGSIDRFLLFPTRFHAQGDHVTSSSEAFTPGKEWEEGDRLVFDTVCAVDQTYELTNWKTVKKLSPFHIWSEKCISDRFQWEGKGMAEGSIQLAVIRAYELAEPIEISYSKRLGGCRSWVELEELTCPNVERLNPILDNREHLDLTKRIGAQISFRVK